MDTVLWIAQGLGAALFLMAGFTKVATPIDKLVLRMAFINDFPAGTARFIGICQILGAVGLVVPMLTNIVPVLTPIAAAALATNMLLAAIYHISKKEWNFLPINFALFALVAFIAVGRFMSI